MPVLKVKQDGVWKEIITGASSGSNIELDQTLTIEGIAADAKAVGDAIDGVITQIYDAGSIDIDLNGSDFSEPNSINADTLGGINADEYAKLSDLENISAGMTMELLWENASPDSEFAGAGTINLSESCECGVMVSRVQPSSSAHLTSIIFTNVLCRTSYTTGNFDESWYRGFTLNGSSISVGTARRNGNVDDAIIIPYRFYGIKGGVS